MSKRISRSLSAQLFCGVLLSLLAAAVVFVLCFLAGGILLEQTVYGKQFIDKMETRAFSQLQAYVTEENISEKNLHQLNAWCSRGDQVYLTIYIDNVIRYESPVALYGESDESVFDIAFENPNRKHTLLLTDGTVAQAFLYYYAGDAYYYWAIVLSGLVSFTVFSLCFILFVRQKLKYVKRMKTELDILAGGDLRFPVTLRGEDELGELAIGIDQMRRSILAHQEVEEKIRLANSQLVTAMSHDLRTPLTSLLAYLELLDRGKYVSEEQMRYFIHRSLDKTLLIKSMADKLFEYFLVYTSEWEHPEMEETDADGLFQQFWGEYAFSLENRGFTVQTDFGRLDGTVVVNVDFLRRAFDNLYANLLKYADMEQSLRISYHRNAEHIYFELVNYISPQRDAKESSNIGLNTCQRILQYHGGTFSAEEVDGAFYVSVTLPLKNERDMSS